MKYFKLDDEVYAFESDGSQDFLITDDFVPMTGDEVDRHCYPAKYPSDEEKEVIRLASFMSLTRRQFKLTLLEHDLLQTVENAIAAIEDVKLRTRIQIEYTESEKFERQSESVKHMLSLIDLTDEQADEMWLQAMTF